APADGGRLGHPLPWTMETDLPLSEALQPQPPRLAVQGAADRDLRIGATARAPSAAKARVARFLPSAYPAKERLEGQITAYRDMLHYLRWNRRPRGPGGFAQRQCRLLLVAAQRVLARLPGGTPGSQQLVVQPAALLKLLLKETLLLFVRVQALRERLTHIRMGNLKHACCQGERLFIPMPEGRGPPGRRKGR